LHRYSYYRQLAELDWDDETSVAATKAKMNKEKKDKAEA
jgi:hypothetical protein